VIESPKATTSGVTTASIRNMAGEFDHRSDRDCRYREME
jgi:hypothetical protein